MGSLRVPLLYIFFLFAGSAYAQEMSLFVWQPTPLSPKVLMPLPAGMSKTQAVEAYLKSINADASILKNLLGYSPLPTNVQGTLTEFVDSEARTEPIVGVIANDFSDLHPDGMRVLWNLRVLKSYKSEGYVIAPASDLFLTVEQRPLFHKAIADTVDVLLSQGGDLNVDPALSGRESISPGKHAPAVDRAEIALIKAVAATKRGIVFGICRGHQVVSIAFHDQRNDYHLLQNIPEDVPNNPITHRSGWHDIQIKPFSWLYHAIGGRDKMKVASVHNQATVLTSGNGGPLESIADDGQGDVAIVEASQGKNVDVYTVQFHPEIMFTWFFQKLYYAVMGAPSETDPRAAAAEPADIYAQSTVQEPWDLYGSVRTPFERLSRLGMNLIFHPRLSLNSDGKGIIQYVIQKGFEALVKKRAPKAEVSFSCDELILE